MLNCEHHQYEIKVKRTEKGQRFNLTRCELNIEMKCADSDVSSGDVQELLKAWRVFPNNAV